MKREVQYLADGSLDDAGDRELRGLLSTCFTKPGDEVFRTRRYWREPYKHRCLNEDGKGWKPVKGMMKQMTDINWPDGDVHLAGLKF